MLCIREGKKRLAQQINARADEQSESRAAVLRVHGGLKTCRLFVPFHLSKKDGEKRSFPERYGVNYHTASNRLNVMTAYIPSLDSLLLPLTHLHLIYVKVRERTALTLFFLNLWPGFLRASERIGETLIARHLTYPFPQLDVQPCDADGKCLSEGHRLGMQLAGCALVLYCWPSYLGAAVECGGSIRLERSADSV